MNTRRIIERWWAEGMTIARTPEAHVDVLVQRLTRSTLDVLVLDAFAAHRLTRLVTRDTITRPIRARIIRGAYEHAPGWIGLANDAPGEGVYPLTQTESEWDSMPHDDDDAPKLAAFITCPWCVGLWISFGVVVARRYASGAWDPIARALALSSAAALLAGHEVER